jgi:hypothetical protein
MDLQKIGAKLFVTEGASIPLQEFVPVFHRWIQDSTIPGILIDVVDYRHVHRGPGVMLIGHDFHLAIDDENGRRGLSIDWKRALSGDAPARLTAVLRTAVDAGIALERESLPGGGIRFGGECLTIRLGDRALTPNDNSTWNSFRPLLDQLLGRLYGTAAVQVRRDPDSRRRLAAEVSAPSPVPLDDLRARLGPPT